MQKISRNYVEIFLLSLIIFAPKWICSFFFFPEENLLIKTILDINDVHYFSNVISFSNLDINPTFNEFVKAEKIITFPFFSIIAHSLLFKFISYFSFIVLEFLLIFLSIFIFLRILNSLGFDNKFCYIISIFFFSLPFLLFFLNFVDFPKKEILQDLVSHFIDPRFPRPLVTNIVFLLGFYLLINLHNEIKSNNQPKSIFFIGILMFFQIHTFFYFFFTQFFTTLILIFSIKKKETFNFIIKNYKIIIYSFFIVSIGLFLFLIQNIFGESDFSNRISLINISISDKIFLIKYFFLSLLRPEILLIIAISATALFLLKKFTKNNNNEVYIFVYFIIASFISIIFFILFFNKIISLYHFANIFLFSFVFFIFLSFFLIINNFQKLTSQLVNFRFIIYVFIFFIALFINSLKLENIDSRKNFTNLNSVLNNFKSEKKDLYLFTNNLRVQSLWLLRGFSNIYITNGFNNSLNDKQIEEHFSKSLRFIFNDDSDFIKLLKFKNNKDHRNSIISHFFSYKYQANSLYTFSEANDYTLEEIQKIKNSSPLRLQIHIIPKSEILRLEKIINNQVNKIDVNSLLVVIDKKSWPESFSLRKNIRYKFNIFLDNEHFFVAHYK